ncbi:hypothetical protein [Streptomyces sp. TRM64462]|uniref:hypothetical protein n=1 Tax=Streptomyces sp. TRM64462 TaxID=2741726 RepID=UPI001585E757|nr:hypothetical protein [Streptomyces sp. TRM64462]
MFTDGKSAPEAAGEAALRVFTGTVRRPEPGPLDALRAAILQSVEAVAVEARARTVQTGTGQGNGTP